MTEKPDRGTHGATPAHEPTPEDLRQRIEGTREELGHTVEALAAKADVKAQAQEKAADAREKAAEAREKAADAAHRAQDKAALLLRSAKDSTPEPVREAASHAATAAGRNRGPVLAGAAVAALAAVLLLARRSRGHRS